MGHDSARRGRGKRSLPRTVALVAVVGAAIGVLGAGTAISDEDADEPLQHVALGDSYASGLGAGDYDEGTEASWQGGDACYRSAHAFGRGLLDEAGLEEADTEHVACAGATAAGLQAAADETDHAPQPAQGQIEALEADTDLVTLSIGGNDAGFAEVLTTCQATERCDELFAAPTSDDAEDLVAQRIDATFPAVVGALEAIQARAEDAAVVLVGYPRLFAAEEEPPSGLAAEELAWLEERNDQLNAMLDDAAATAGVTFVDGVAEAFDGHEVNGEEPWIHGADPEALVDGSVAEWFHPTREGHEAIRTTVAEDLEGGLPDAPDSVDRSGDYPDGEAAPTIASLRWNDQALPARVVPGERLEGEVVADAIVEGEDYDVALHPGGTTLASAVTPEEDGRLTVDAEVPEDLGEGVGALVVTGEDGEGDPVLLAGPAIIGDPPITVPERVERLAGPDRAATAAAVAEDAFDGSDQAVLASSEDHADALAGGPLAATLDAPLLLTDPDALSEATAEALEDLEVAEVTIVGGEQAVSEDVAAEVADVATVEEAHRVAGETRYETAAEVAEEIGDASDDALERVFLAASETALPGTGWPDAVSVGAYAGASQAPVLLTRTEELPEATREALEELAPSAETVVAGGTAVVREEVLDDIAAAVDEAPTRLAGLTRYGTSRAVASAAVEADVLDPSEVWVTTGRHWADALAAGPAAAQDEASLVLVDGTTPLSSSATVGWLARQDTATERLVLVGGTSAIDASFLELLTD